MNGPIKAAEPRRLYQQIADQIRALIQGGHFVSGARLPAERDLAQQLGVSRPSLREALIALEIEGSVEIRMGSGIYITAEPERRTWQTGSMGESPVELMEARAAVEGSVALAAAARISAEGLTSLREALDAMRSEIAAGRKPLDQDRLFHLTIAGQSGNSVLAHIVGDLFDERHSPLSAQIRTRFETPETWRNALREHEAIYDALDARDPLLAQAMMHAHLEESKRRWMENEPR
ncbi:GntR family transcriptional repressor for pyruvate dehydrogenase complex [Pseudorhizobium tarimense]|uniref:GntR family transcriptional repressor for pyruvate dehydrogenase complex n=1 Tax=Pseudorhizobium tarimense TaxID=1079109 RepID=A0ABV2HCB3_9HYPH|nr:FadR/GntR family transcriptional regulator [Pseudorhizobium tarimense]MCJ8521200.1 FadR family transcriptional regulator [Pseudorhizobium tarimense]